MEEVIDFIKAYILKEFIITGNPKREERWQYPIEAVRELVINAIVHRDYRGFHSQFKIFPKKIELINSGGLPFDLTVEDILDGSKRSEPRNRLIAEIFRDCGFIERYGSGIQRANLQLLEYNLPPLDIEVKENTFKLTLFSEVQVTPQVTALEVKIINIIKKDNKISIREIAELLEISSDTVKEYIKRLKDKDILIRKGKTSAGYWELL
ncbi:MAG: winged helix-turn-helix transcriptional regulator [Nanohaloarchaea archaeon]|nr:winged helix-turn-helix transcriptional regulator [Candidatus Nanohaloarchaea archaeon]